MSATATIHTDGISVHYAAFTSYSCFVCLFFFPFFPIFLQSQAEYQAQKPLITKDLQASDLRCGPISVPHCKPALKH